MIPDIDHARRRLTAGLDELDQCAAELRQWSAIYEERAKEEDGQAKEELAQHARSAQAPQELRRLQEQVDRGELSWYGALTGEADDVIDRRAGAFLAERLASLPMLGEALRSGASAQEAVELVASAQERLTAAPVAGDPGSVRR
jgi:hypothetical protein